MERILQKIGFLFFTQFIYLSSFAQLDGPDNLTAIPESSSRITLEWTASTDNVDNYGIERSESETEGWVEIDVINGNRTSYQDQGLTSGITYYYRIRAITTLENSAYSNTANATTFSAPQAPTATAATDISLTSFTANWTLVTEATSYELDVSADEFVSFIPGYEALSVTGSAYNVTGLEPGTAYKYRVRAVNANGISLNSENTLLTTAVPTPPPAPTATAATDITQTGFTANWSSVTEATGYELDVSGNNFASLIPGYEALAISGTSQNVSGLTPATFYEYRVRAINADGESESSNVISVTTENVPLPPPAPTATFATNIETTSFTANWTPVEEATGYELDVSGNNFASLIPGYEALAVSSTSHNVINLEPSTPYKYKVRAVNDNGISVSSNEIEVTTEDLPPPAAPTQLTASASSASQIDLTWVDNATDEDNYIVESSATSGGPFVVLATLGTGATTYNHMGLDEGTTVYYRVSAMNATGSSAPSNEANATTLSKPNAPSNLTASAISDTEINLSWADNADNEENYVIESSATSDGTYTVLATLGVGSIAYNHTGLNEGVTVYYRVRATNTTGSSEFSNTANATTLSKPASPTNLVATATSGTEINLSWADNADNEENYVIESSATSNGTYTVLATLGVGSIAYSHTGLSEGVTVYYRVRATNTTGSSEFSNTANATTLSKPAPPTNLVATATSGTEIKLTWADNANNEENYVVESSATSDGVYTELATLGVGSITYNHTGLSEGTTIYYKVRATNTIGSSAFSNTANATTLSKPNAPSNLTASAISGTEIKLAWTDNANNEDNYIVESSTTSGGSYTVLETLGPNVTAFNHTGLTGGTTVYYKLRAVNEAGSSAFTEEANATTDEALPAPPAVPTGFTASSASSSKIDLNWTDNATNETNYILEWRKDESDPWTALPTLPANSTSYSHTGLTSNTTYRYQLKATNAGGDSGYATANAKTATSILAPSAPTNLTAENITSTGFKAKWNAVLGATNYYIDVSTDADFVSFVSVYKNKQVALVNSEEIIGLTPNTPYYVRVRASNIIGTSGNSGVLEVRTLMPTPSVPTGLAADNVTSTGFTAKWSVASNASGYEIDVSTDDFTTFVSGYEAKVTSSNSIAITGLTPNTTYKFQLRAVNADGKSVSSSPFTVKTLVNAPNAPVISEIEVITSKGFTVNWTAVSGASSYEIDISIDGFTSFVAGYDAKSVSGTTLGVNNLNPDTDYTIRVRAVNLGGPSPNSNEISVTTLPAIPTKPVTIAATNITASSFTARWNPSTGATSYQLDVSADNFQTFLPGFNSKTITGTSASVTGLSPNTPYQYRVRAKNAGGTSISSNDRSVTTLNLQPAAPVASSATSKSKNGFTVHWSRVLNAEDYRFDLSTNNFSSYITAYQNKVVTDTFLIVTGLSPETSYQYRVRAVNNGGTSSNSNVISETTLPDVPGQPTALTASNVAQNSFTANWEEMLGSTSYELDVSKDNFLTFVPGYSSKSVTGTSVEVTGLSPKTAYKYRIRSMNAGGESVNSNVIDVTTLPALPAAPVAYDAASITQTGFKASWSLVPGATEYQFDLSNDNFATNIPGYNNLVVTDTPLVVSNLVANSTYKYRVRAVNAAGISPNSNIITITTLPNPPDAPVAKEATDIRKTRFTAHWTSVSNATEYYIDVSSDNFNTLLPNYDIREITDTTLEITGLLVNTTYQYRVRAGNRAGISGNSNTMNVTTLPNIFGSPLVTNTETLEDTQSPPDLTVQRSLPEDPDITYFKVSNIIGGTLYKNDGITQIQEGAFITVEDGKQGLRFTPGLNSIENGSFDVQASSNNNNSGLSGEIATATITVLPVNDPPLLSNDDSEPLLFSQGDLNTVITTSMLVEDVDDTLLDSAVIQIVEGYEKGRDFIFFKNTDEIQVKPYDSENGILVLIGKAEKSVWEEALNSVLFYNNYIGEAAVGLKTVTFKIWDGKAYSEPVEKRIQITDVFVEINIPEGITPNDDGTNDLWTIENIDLYPDCIVEVYGKNGQRLFQSQGYKEKWNGSHNNQPLGIGTYYYFIDLREKGKKYKGTVAILR